ncbi:MAG: murein biosynthesis integral membrane protein MurJ [Nitriliruptorales bacterium]|nr:murein biosynthesis integral membrane protein MurJ [Nitriliruptorales bacterium]
MTESEAPDASPDGATTASSAAVGASRRNSALVAAGILLSRLSGLVREKLIGYFLGAGVGVEAFRTALRIPNLMQNLLGEGVLSASFIPIYARLLEEGKEEEAGKVAGAVAGLLALVAGVLVVLGVVFARPITSVIALGFPEGSDKFELTVTLVRIITPGIGFLVLSAWCLGVLNSHRRFFLSYVAPVLWNAAMITALVVFGVRGADADTTLPVALAWGTLIGGGLQFALQFPGVIAVTRGLRPSLDVQRRGVRRVISAFGPVVAGRGVVQLSAYLDTIIASFLATGAIAALGFAQTLYVLPVSLFGMSVAAAELPELSSMDHADRASMRRRLDDGLARIAFFVAPSAVGFVIVGDLIVGLLYQGGQFGAQATVQVWAVLAAYSLGLLASTGARLLQSALYGVGDPRTPAKLAAVRVVLSAGLGFLLMLQLDQFQITAAEKIAQVGALPSFEIPAPEARAAEENLFRLGAAGLALAAAVAAWLEYGLLLRAVRRRFGPVKLLGNHLRPILVATAVAAVVAGGARLVLGGLSPWIGGPIAVLTVGGAYLVTAWRLDLPELKAAADVLSRRFSGDEPADPSE